MPRLIVFIACVAVLAFGGRWTKSGLVLCFVAVASLVLYGAGLLLRVALGPRS